MATIESLDLAGLQYNPDDVAAALADLLTVNGVTLTDIIASLESSSATQFVSKYNSTTNVLDNIILGSNVSGRGAVKFVSIGKPAVNTSGTAGVDYPEPGHTWVCFAIQSGYEANTANAMGFGFGGPALMLQNNGDWGANNANAPIAWTSRDMAPDGSAFSQEQNLNTSFSSAGTDGSSAIYVGHNYTHTIDFENLN